jgi:hypothetical protein
MGVLCALLKQMGIPTFVLPRQGGEDRNGKAQARKIISSAVLAIAFLTFVTSVARAEKIRTAIPQANLN